MENNYRDMMDAVKAPEGLRREVMKMSEQERTKKARPVPVRVVLVAACVAALLAVGAVAAEVSGVDIVETIKTALGLQVSEPKTIIRPTDEAELEGWTVALPEGIAEDHLSAEFWAELQSAEPDEYDMRCIFKEFQSREELKAYLGVAPTLNPLLEQGDIALEGHGGWHLEGRSNAEVEITYVWVTGNFSIPVPETDGKTIHVLLDTWVSTAERPSGGIYFENVEEVIQEEYVTKNGLKAVLSNTRFAPTEENPEYYGGCGIAEFYLDGFAYRLRVWYDTQWTEGDQVTATLKSILDAYEVPQE